MKQFTGDTASRARSDGTDTGINVECAMIRVLHSKVFFPAEELCKSACLYIYLQGLQLIQR